MKCPICEAIVKNRSQFCSTCGHRLPVVVGASYPFGIRFPLANGKMFQVALHNARLAPAYAERMVDGSQYHIALYDRMSMGQLAKLYAMAYAAFNGQRSLLIEHTTDGRHFFSGPSFWRCLTDRVEKITAKYPEVNHWGAKCHSYFGCLSAQRRQHEMYHDQGWEVFYHGRHGFFPCDEDKLACLQENNRLGRNDLARVMNLDIFNLDKGKIRAEVLTLIKRAGCNKCPCFSSRYLEAQLESLPGTVHLGLTPGWQFLNCQMLGPAVAYHCYQNRVIDLLPELPDLSPENNPLQGT